MVKKNTQEAPNKGGKQGNTSSATGKKGGGKKESDSAPTELRRSQRKVERQSAVDQLNANKVGKGTGAKGGKADRKQELLPTRTSTRIIKKPKRDLSPTLSPQKKQAKHVPPPPPRPPPTAKEKPAATGTTNGGEEPVKKKRKKGVEWTVQDKNLFFEAISEHGRDFDAIRKHLATKHRKRPELQRSKDQVRHLFYRTWSKLSKHVKSTEEVSKHALELYSLINYGELRRRGIYSLDDKIGPRLNELVHKGFTTIRLKGKNVRFKTPVCKALMKLNRIQDKEEAMEQVKLREYVTLELYPKDNKSWVRVQQMSHNPRLRIKLKSDRRISSIIDYLNNKWKPHRARIKESIDELERPFDEIKIFPSSECKYVTFEVQPRKPNVRPDIAMDTYKEHIKSLGDSTISPTSNKKGGPRRKKKNSYTVFEDPSQTQNTKSSHTEMSTTKGESMEVDNVIHTDFSTLLEAQIPKIHGHIEADDNAMEAMDIQLSVPSTSGLQNGLKSSTSGLKNGSLPSTSGLQKGSQLSISGLQNGSLQNSASSNNVPLTAKLGKTNEISSKSAMSKINNSNVKSSVSDSRGSTLDKSKICDMTNESKKTVSKSNSESSVKSDTIQSYKPGSYLEAESSKPPEQIFANSPEPDENRTIVNTQPTFTLKEEAAKVCEARKEEEAKVCWKEEIERKKEQVKRGLTSKFADDITVADLCLMMGNPEKIMLEYCWVDKIETPDLGQLGKLTNMLKRLVYLASTEFSDVKHKKNAVQQLLREKSPPRCTCGALKGASGTPPNSKLGTRSPRASPAVHRSRGSSTPKSSSSKSEPKTPTTPKNQSSQRCGSPSIPTSKTGTPPNPNTSGSPQGTFKVPTSLPPRPPTKVPNPASNPNGIITDKALLDQINGRHPDFIFPRKQRRMPRMRKPIVIQRKLLPRNENQSQQQHPLVTMSYLQNSMAQQQSAFLPMGSAMYNSSQQPKQPTNVTIVGIADIMKANTVKKIIHTPEGAPQEYVLNPSPAPQPVEQPIVSEQQPVAVAVSQPESTPVNQEQQTTVDQDSVEASFKELLEDITFPETRSEHTVPVSEKLADPVMPSQGTPNVSSLLDISLPSTPDLHLLGNSADFSVSSLLDTPKHIGKGGCENGGANLQLSPSKTMDSVEPWLNGEDFNLSSLLESPAKRDLVTPTSVGVSSSATLTTPYLVNDNSRDSMISKFDVDTTLQCLMNESSIDYVSKFADLVQHVTTATEVDKRTQEKSS